jgi:long-chain acyl-CoA synthetase
MGPAVFKNYFREPEKTAAGFAEEGWHCTGDIGQIMENGALKIMDRCTNMFKLAHSSGAYISPVPLEIICQYHPLVSSMFAYGDSQHAYLVGVVVLEPTHLEEWAKSKGLEDVKEDPNNYPELREHIHKGLEELREKHDLKE